MNSNCDFYEIERLRQMSIFESMLSDKGYSKIAGVDEAGRGPLAGPLVVAACILPKSFYLEELNDSKQLTKEQRESHFDILTNNPDVVYSYIVVDEKRIDTLNILQATMDGMKKAVEALKTPPDYVLVDGNKMPNIKMRGESIVSGDANSISIASASIIAKVIRDKIMDEMQEKYPIYSFSEHKGYGTKKHLDEIKKFGPCPIHRESFEPIKSMLNHKQLNLPLE